MHNINNNNRTYEMLIYSDMDDDVGEVVSLCGNVKVGVTDTGVRVSIVIDATNGREYCVVPLCKKLYHSEHVNIIKIEQTIDISPTLSYDESNKALMDIIITVHNLKNVLKEVDLAANIEANLPKVVLTNTDYIACNLYSVYEITRHDRDTASEDSKFLAIQLVPSKSNGDYQDELKSKTIYGIIHIELTGNNNVVFKVNNILVIDNKTGLPKVDVVEIELELDNPRWVIELNKLVNK